MKPRLIETMLAQPQGDIGLWDLHMKRLQRSATSLSYPCPTVEAIHSLVQTKLLVFQAHNDHTSSHSRRVRLLLNQEGEIEVTVHTLMPLISPQKVAISTVRLQSHEAWLKHKTTHRPWYQSATDWLQKNPDYFDVLFLNERNELCEGTRSNVYLKLNDQWLTPSLQSGVLPGVWRQKVLEEELAQESTLQEKLLNTQTPIRLSNGLRGWFDVSLDLTVEVK